MRTAALPGLCLPHRSGGESLTFDLALYLLTLLLGFGLPLRFSGPFRGLRWQLPLAAAAGLGLLLAVFTLYPPDAPLFWDLSGVRTWISHPL